MTHSPAANALHLVSIGRASEALAILRSAGDRGDVDAIMQLAVWHLAGDVVARDLVQARALLARAVSIGHVDAALMEIALTANGSGGTPDWPGAVSLLRTAARADPVALGQLTLLDAMAIDAAGAPTALPVPETLSETPDVIRFPRLLTAAECAHLAGVAAAMLEPARVIDPRTGRWIAHPIRTSDGTAIGPAREDLVVRAINRRIAAASGTDIGQGEPLTVLRYRPGQQYRLHLDTIQDAANQRVATVLVYLNEGYGGGETHFPAGNLTITPRGGDAIVFRTLTTDGAIDQSSRHAGLPVTHGAKWLATRWIRADPIDPWTIS
ncbi:prolyl 4-hydroxylase [Sphingomonas aurantiaca]|uniref:Prolyl 4-hydroxylase n=1 Tax=Sphingomonas aurantiaca TaxID=185949 RepID=A0A2T5GT34_9SPHN|nr:2OG-Fe(II) oxygenase [Sphingomonas aurantiaca]PTQ62482.1 prolyl 4-hydroxylase [Sphingomonas aurantiaca]